MRFGPQGLSSSIHLTAGQPATDCLIQLPHIGYPTQSPTRSRRHPDTQKAHRLSPPSFRQETRGLFLSSFTTKTFSPAPVGQVPKGRRPPFRSFTAILAPKLPPSFRAVARTAMTLHSKIATASRSREISQINDCNGLTPPPAMLQRRHQTVRLQTSDTTSVSAAVGTLMTPPKRAIAPARGSPPRGELPNGVRSGDGIGPKGLISSEPKAKAVSVIPVDMKSVPPHLPKVSANGSKEKQVPILF